MEWKDPTECSLCSGEFIERDWSEPIAYKGFIDYTIEVVWVEYWYCSSCHSKFAERRRSSIIVDDQEEGGA